MERFARLSLAQRAEVLQETGDQGQAGTRVRPYFVAFNMLVFRKGIDGENSLSG